MLVLNKIQKTITGKEVKPFTVQGDVVYCFDNKGEVIYVDINEFDFTSKKEKKTIYVNPIESLNTDELFEPEEEKDGFFEEEKVEEEPKVIKKKKKTKKKKVEKVEKKVETAYIPDDDYI